MTSIFGDVSNGVPNPVVAHAHPYPTRYHGQNLIQPQATFSYREQSYMVPHQASIVRQPLRGSPDGIGQGSETQTPQPTTVYNLNEKYPNLFMVYRLLSLVGAASGAYHGYKRNDSIGWAIGWFLLGGMFPVITIPVSLAQGYGKPHEKHVYVDR